MLSEPFLYDLYDDLCRRLKLSLLFSFKVAAGVKLRMSETD